MQTNFYVKCDVCGKVLMVKYQMGYVKRHHIRFKCECGVTIKGEKDIDGITFHNGTQIKADGDLPDYVIHVSSELLTVRPYKVKKVADIMRPTSFIRATQLMDYEKYQSEFSAVWDYKEKWFSKVTMINELFEANNLELLEKIVRKEMGMKKENFPMKTKADVLRVMAHINQLQFMRIDEKGILKNTMNYFMEVLHKNRSQVEALAMFFERKERIKSWKKRIIATCTMVNEKLEYILPAIGSEYYKGGVKAAFDEGFVITTTSFEDIKQLYVDLYELICEMAIIVVGFDNIYERNNFNSLRDNNGIKMSTLEEFSNITKKGKVVNYISTQEKFENLICELLSSDIRNAIGHYSYEGEEVANQYGQIIRFLDIKDKKKYIDVSLIEICHDIWQMYKSLTVFYELIYRIETVNLSRKGVTSSTLQILDSDINLKSTTIRKPPKIYPNEKCPCQSGKKYKNCCGKNL